MALTLASTLFPSASPREPRMDDLLGDG